MVVLSIHYNRIITFAALTDPRVATCLFLSNYHQAKESEKERESGRSRRPRERRKKVYNLLRAEIAPKTIFEIVGVSIRIVYNMQKEIKDGKGLQKKSGSGGGGKEIGPGFVNDLSYCI